MENMCIDCGHVVCDCEWVDDEVKWEDDEYFTVPAGQWDYDALVAWLSDNGIEPDGDPSEILGC